MLKGAIMKPILITAGHSNSDPGTVNEYMKIKEADIVRDMRNMVALYLNRNNVPVITDGDGLVNWSLSRAVDEIKNSCFAVEFHCNAANSKQANGTEALAKIIDKDISQKLCGAIALTMDTRLRGEGGWKPENSGQHSRLAFVSNGGIILEMFFISNDNEVTKWKAVKWLVAKEVAKVLTQHYNYLKESV